MLSDIYELTEYVTEWSSQFIAVKDPEIMLSKLIDELEELKETPCDGHEMADIMIIFLDYCDTVGVDIVKAVHYKMEINKKRTWELDKDGKLQHKRIDESEPRDEVAYCGLCENAITGGTPVECLYPGSDDCGFDGKSGKRYTKSGDEIRPDSRHGRDCDGRRTLPV